MAGYKVGTRLPGLLRGGAAAAGSVQAARVTAQGMIPRAQGGGNGNGQEAGGEGVGGGGEGGGNGNGKIGGNGGGNGGGGRGYMAAGGPGGGASAKEQLLEVLHVIFKRWRLITLVFGVVTLSGLISVLSRGAKYSAVGEVMITSDRADSVIQPTDQESLALLRLNDSVVNSETHLIQSRELIEQVVRGLALARAGGSIVNLASAADDREAISAQARRLRAALKVTPIRGSHVIEIRLESGDPSEASQIVNRIIDEYLAYHALVHSQPGLSGFYEEQSTLLVQNLRTAEKTLGEYALRGGIVSPVAEIQAAVSSLTGLEQELQRSSSLVAGEEERVRMVREQLAAQPDVVRRSQTLEVNPVVKQLRDRITDLQADEIALLKKYTESDRHVVDTRREISELTTKMHRALAGEALSVSGETLAPNPVYEARLSELLKAEAKLRFHQASKAVLEEEVAQQRRQLVGLKQRAMEFERLDQEVQRQRAAVELYSRRQQEAAIEDAMDQRKLVNVAVVERPGLPLDRSDKRTVPLMLALISGLAVSLGGAFGIEYLNRTLRFEREVERYLGLPVVGKVAEENS